ncbi:uncharacterized protein A1O5_11474 [Cladophialophora psammophila CBS 110553]|uniref:Uncharacterized protein n=1 Tax=Cladophialophora psammophila CBS 110553 TaxID=1182543 RepID=W9WEL2_9EURO|nr:uncharacterized protein A1O5_11474 [Cladophialophora psammophila CBS 110553]EXJ63425.1 hypothetical protein A1O5_11474 [Cladophialophora psammophila CBS 110553]
MSDHKDDRPTKQRRIHGMPLLDQTSQIDDDEDSSSSSSSSFMTLPTARLSHRLLNDAGTLHTENSSDNEESEVQDEEETTSSSDSEDSDGEETSEREEEEEEEEGGEDVEEPVPPRGPGIPRFTTLPARGSDLKSRVQNFLPQLQRANAELEDSSQVFDRRIDHVSDDADHYIEMEVGLGVLTAQKDDTTRIMLPHSPSSVEEDRADEDEEVINAHGGSEDGALSRVVGMEGRKGTKRKIEELG